MSDPAAIAAAIVTVIVASATAIVTIVNAVANARYRVESRDDRKTQAQIAVSTDKKADTIIQQGAEIHSVTNGNLSKVQAQLAVAQTQLDVSHQEIKGLTDKVLSLEHLIAALIAKQESPLHVREIHHVDVITAPLPPKDPS